MEYIQRKSVKPQKKDFSKNFMPSKKPPLAIGKIDLASGLRRIQPELSKSALVKDNSQSKSSTIRIPLDVISLL